MATEDTGGKLGAYGRRAFEVAASIAFPRLVGGAGEARARARVKAAMEAAGLEASEEFFDADDFPVRVLARWALAPTGALLLLSALALSAGLEAGALVLALVSFLPAALVARRVQSGFHGRPRRSSDRCANVIGRARSGRAGAPTLLLMAHADSKSQSFPIWLRVALFVVGGLGSLALVAPIVACAVVRRLGFDCWFEPALLPLAGLLFAVDLSLIANGVGDLSDGALDNATGVGIIVELAARLKDEAAGAFDLVVAATAAEEIGLCGANALLERHGVELDPAQTWVLNFDGCGGGREVGVLRAHGLPPRRMDPALLESLRAAARSEGASLREYYIPTGMATDMLPFRRAGYRGVDFLGMAVQSHRPRDRMELVLESSLADHVKVALALIRSLRGR